MVTGAELRARRAAAGITGQAVCVRSKISRSRLSDIELGYLIAGTSELQRISNAIDEIISERQQISELAESHGLSLTAVGL